MGDARRRIGPIGTASRVFLGLGLLYLAGGASGLSWEIRWSDAAVGLLALPAIMVAVGLIGRRYATGPIRFTGPLGVALNCAAIVALVSNEYTGGGATLFYGATLLLAAWQGQPGCEGTVLSNLILRRDDQIGCPVFSPLDGAERRFARRSGLRQEIRAGDAVRG